MSGEHSCLIARLGSCPFASLSPFSLNAAFSGLSLHWGPVGLGLEESSQRRPPKRASFLAAPQAIHSQFLIPRFLETSFLIRKAHPQDIVTGTP